MDNFLNKFKSKIQQVSFDKQIRQSKAREAEIEERTPQVMDVLKDIIKTAKNPTSLDDFAQLSDNRSEVDRLLELVKRNPAYKVITSLGFLDPQIWNLILKTIVRMKDENLDQLSEVLSSQVVRASEQEMIQIILKDVGEYVTEVEVAKHVSVTEFTQDLSATIINSLNEIIKIRRADEVKKLAPTGKTVEGNTKLNFFKDANSKRKQLELQLFIEQLPNECANGKITTATQLATRLTDWCNAHIRN